MQLSKKSARPWNNISSSLKIVDNNTYPSDFAATFFIGSSIVFLSLLAFILNATHQQYVGNDYTPPDMGFIAIALMLMYMGAYLLFGTKNRLGYAIKEVIYFFIMMTVLLTATQAVQYTPFKPIDQTLVNVESMLNIHLGSIMSWVQQFPTFKVLLGVAYDSLAWQMCFIPLLVIATGHFYHLREYYFLFLFTALMGFTIYYFFPTLGPASLIDSPYFSESQRATGLKFTQIHQYQEVSTLDGGMVAFPSFHVIWAWLCLYLTRIWPLVFFTLLPVNLLLVASCVLLGWHYSIDLMGSLMVIVFSHKSYRYLSRL